MPNDHDIPYNVILLPDFVDDSESLIDAYTEIICDCRSKSEIRAAIKMIVDEAEELNVKKALVRNIKSLAEILDNK